MSILVRYLFVHCFNFLSYKFTLFSEPTLACISDDLGLSSDVAGATFMAIGSSAPELLTSLVDAFGTKASVGIGTILGSAMFNILVIVAAVTVFGKSSTGGVLYIKKWPLSRDSIFYLISIICLTVVVLNDGHLCVLRENKQEIYFNGTGQTNITDADLLCYVGLVTPIEGLFLVMVYIGYIIFMIYNRSIHVWFNEHVSFRLCAELCGRPTKSKPKTNELNQWVAEMEKHEQQGHGKEEAEEEEEKEEVYPDADEEEFPSNPCTGEWPSSFGGKVYRVIGMPYYILFYCTLPACLPAGTLRNSLLFIGNIAWIAGLTIAMVYTGTRAGCLMGVDPFILGYVFLAAGTSVPDALSSIIVARNGRGDMAISNVLGSNVFDILLGLGLPWFLADLVYGKDVAAVDGMLAGSFVTVNGILIGVGMLVGALILFVSSLACFRWRAVKPMGVMLMIYYIAFLAFVILTNRCVIPICFELDCERCGFEPAW